MESLQPQNEAYYAQSHHSSTRQSNQSKSRSLRQSKTDASKHSDGSSPSPHQKQKVYDKRSRSHQSSNQSSQKSKNKNKSYTNSALVNKYKNMLKPSSKTDVSSKQNQKNLSLNQSDPNIDIGDDERTQIGSKVNNMDSMIDDILHKMPRSRSVDPNELSSDFHAEKHKKHNINNLDIESFRDRGMQSLMSGEKKPKKKKRIWKRPQFKTTLEHAHKMTGCRLSCEVHIFYMRLCVDTLTLPT